MATRDRLAPQSPQQPQRSSSSPASSSSALPSSSTATSLSQSQPVSSHALLRLHEATPDPKLAALEQAVNERNVLAAQNTQLWKLIEKQRSGYNQILKELDRIRGERDAYKTKVVALGGSVDRKGHKPSDRKTRTEVDSPDTSSRQLSQDNSPSSF
jgi:RalA-binding protein 1